MKLQNSRLIIDVKVQDEYRKWFSSLGLNDELAAGSVILGDSDVDYELAPDINNTRVLGAPYNVGGVKHKLIYNGVGKNLAGVIKCFVRKIDSSGNILSIYDYSSGDGATFTIGKTPPELSDGKDWDIVEFEDDKMGYIFYFQTILDYYLDENNTKKRIKENYTMTVDWDGTETAPANWEYVLDTENGSLMIAKNNTESSPIGLNYRGRINVYGELSKKTKIIEFNF